MLKHVSWTIKDRKLEVVADYLLYAFVYWGTLCLDMQTVPLLESAEHQMSSRNHLAKQRLLDSPRVKAGAAAPHILLFCQSLGEHSSLGTEVCQDATVCVLAGVFAARGIWEGSTDIHVPCNTNLYQQKTICGLRLILQHTTFADHLRRRHWDGPTALTVVLLVSPS